MSLIIQELVLKMGNCVCMVETKTWCLLKKVREKKNKVVLKYTSLDQMDIIFDVKFLLCISKSTNRHNTGKIRLAKSHPDFDEIMENIKSKYMFDLDTYFWRDKEYISSAKVVNHDPVTVLVSKIEEFTETWNKITLSNNFLGNEWIALKEEIDAPGCYCCKWRISKEGWAVLTTI